MAGSKDPAVFVLGEFLACLRYGLLDNTQLVLNGISAM
jgi:hypothetical protein